MPHQDDPTFGAERFDTGIAVADPNAEAPDDQETVVGRMIEEAIQWREENLDPELKKATEYYMGEPFGDEEEGRSQVVDTTVRDTVQAMLPSLLRIFFGPEDVVEFAPDRPDQVEVAEAMTKGVNYVVREDNSGFTTFHAAMKDALVRKLGIIKYWWEDKRQVVESQHTGLAAEQVAFFQRQPNIEVEFLEEEDEDDLIEGQSETFEVEIRRVENDGRVRLAAVPPEEFIFSPKARSKDDAALIGHVRELPASELIAMGISPEQVRRHAGKGSDASDDSVDAARRIDGTTRTEDEGPSAVDPVQLAEVYVDLDSDEDGVTEIHRIWAIGDGWEWAKDEEGVPFDDVVDDIPFALLSPDPEPHTMVGLSVADSTMDLQRINSAIIRGMLDSLTQHLRPVTEVVEGQVNMKDVLNPEVGRVVRVRQPGMMREVATEFVGANALPVLQYMNELKENRTGQSKAAVGLDPDALQSSTKAGVAATISAAQQRVELIARIFAETGMTDLFNGIARLLHQHQDRQRMIRVAGEFVPMTPESWNLDLDVTVNVGLGDGLAEEKVRNLMALAEKQEAHLQNGSPIVDFTNLRNTYGRLVEQLGFENTNEFFRPFGEEEQKQFAQQQAQQAQEPTEAERLERVEMAKLKQRQQEKLMELQVEAKKIALKDDRERDKIIRDFIAEMREQDIEIDEARLQAARDALDQDIEQARLTGDILEKLANIEVGADQEPTSG